MAKTPLTYKDAGVDIDAGNALVERIKPLVARTRRPEVLAGIGGFGGLFALDTRFDEPVLVSGTDGVGTKLKLAQALGIHSSVGQDLVAMCVNDILVQGAEPLFFLDYFACGKLDVHVAGDVIGGIAKGCEMAGAALIGGETAEMPDMYAPGEYDLAGFAVGVVERRNLLDGSRIRSGDTLVAIASNGPHSNGYSLIRRVLERDPQAILDGQPAAERLLAPTRIYVRAVLSLIESVEVRGLVHITGGGLSENLPRVLPPGLCIEIDAASLKPGAVFDWLQRTGGIADGEMRRTFNMGVGMVAIVPSDRSAEAIRLLADAGETAWAIGRVQTGAGEVAFV